MDAQGLWRQQHAADFLDNGRLLLYDNLGVARASRVLEYDPTTHAVPWSFMCENLNRERGMAERLPNGNTLVVDGQRLRILEVTPDKEVVWICYCSLPGPNPERTIALAWASPSRGATVRIKYNF